MSDKKNCFESFAGAFLLGFGACYLMLKASFETNKKKEIIQTEEVLEFWFGGDTQSNFKTKWFANGKWQKEIDVVIKNRFTNILERAKKRPLKILGSSPKCCIASIILFDQLSRHIYRDCTDREEKVRECDHIALNLAEKIISKNWQYKLNALENTFALMPFRHKHPPDILKLEMVLEKIEKLDKSEKAIKKVIDKFRKVTKRKIEELKGLKLPNDEILEHFPFEPNKSKINSNKLAITVGKFLNQKELDANQTLVVSLSGGVDSMVLLQILVYLSKSLNFKVVAIHIDYANRNESAKEALFVENWCNGLDVIFRKRVISEVKRGTTDRNLYEKVAREARFTAYREVLIEFPNSKAVMFGHHQGDLQENVISNIFKGCSVLKLAGMAEESSNSGVVIWRPLLSFSKDEIFSFAHEHGVPYFKDSTPLWSTRGKLRNHLIPLLKDMYGVGMLGHLSALAEESSMLYKDLEAKLFKPFWDSVAKTKMGFYVNLIPFRGQNPYFWKEALKRVLHSYSLPMIGDKAICTLIERLRQPDEPYPKQSWWKLRKEYKSFCSSQGKLYILTPLAAPVQPYSIEAHGMEIEINGGSVELGPWIISADSISAADYNFKETFCREPPPFENIEGFIKGKFSYKIFIANKENVTNLVIANFCILENRNTQTVEQVSERKKLPPMPLALKGMEKSLKDCIPIVTVKNGVKLYNTKQKINDSSKFQCVEVKYAFKD